MNAPTSKMLIAASCIMALMAAPQLRAATIAVAPGEVAVAANGACSLREAIHNANTDTQADNSDCVAGSGADTITLAASSSYTLSDADPVDSASGLPDITSEIIVAGNAATIQRDTAVVCTLDGVQASGEFGLVTVPASGNLTLQHLTLSHGCADGNQGRSKDGGAIWVKDTSLLLDHVTVSDNSASDLSGGLDTAYSTITIRDSSFLRNTSLNGGGGIGNGNGSTMTIERSTLADNTAGGQGGGGIGNYRFGNLSIINSTVSGNADVGANGGGGGIGNLGTLELVSSTVSGNASSGALGGGGIANAGTLRIKNSLVANSTSGGDCMSVPDPAITFNTFGANRDTDGSCAALSTNFSQVTSAQLALGALANNGGSTQTLALGVGSVAINAVTDCTDLSVPISMPLTTDQRGQARPQGAACDIGAYETSKRCYVDASATGGTNTGKSWANAYTDLQSALLGTAQCEEIWVASGTYKPTSGTDRSISFNILPGVAAYGGFVGAETAREQRKPMVDATILSGDIDNNDDLDGKGVDADYTHIQGANAFNVVTMDGTVAPITASTVLDGFTITGGDAQGTFPNSGGGGLLCNAFDSGQCSPTLSNLSFSGNNSGDVGGAIYLLGHDSVASPGLSNIIFVGNHASGSGGALYNDGTSGGNSSPTLINITFHANQADDYGGALFNDGSDTGVSSPQLRNITFSGNSALVNGGAIYSITGNGSSSPVLTNVILWNDSAANIGAEMYNAAATPSINYSIVRGGDDASNTGTAFSSGTGNINADPQLSPLADNGGYTKTMALVPTSPAVQAGDNSNCPATDQRGVTRAQGPRCDIGAYELRDLIFANGFDATP